MQNIFFGVFLVYLVGIVSRYTRVFKSKDKEMLFSIPKYLYIIVVIVAIIADLAYILTNLYLGELMSKKIHYNTQVGAANPVNQQYWSNVGNSAVDQYNQNSGSMLGNIYDRDYQEELDFYNQDFTKLKPTQTPSGIEKPIPKFKVDEEHQYQGFTPGDDVADFKEHGGKTPTMQEITTTPTGNPYYIPDEVVQGTGNVGSGAFVTPGYHDVVDFEKQGGPTAGIDETNQGAGGLSLQRTRGFSKGPGYDRWQRAIDRAGQGKVILDPKYRQLLKKHYKETGEYGGHGRPMLKDYKLGSGDWLRAMQEWRSTQLKNPAMQEALDEKGLGNRAKEDLYLGEEGHTSEWDDVLANGLAEDKGMKTRVESPFNRDYSNVGQEFLESAGVDPNAQAKKDANL